MPLVEHPPPPEGADTGVAGLPVPETVTTVSVPARLRVNESLDAIAAIGS